MEVSNLQQFFNGIEDNLEKSRNAQEDAIRGFFTDLTPRLEAARELDEEMNRVFAHRFNVLDYLRTDELGLSRIIADLFNPKASHGQGTFFLRSFLTKLGLVKNSNRNVDVSWPDPDGSDVRVEIEKLVKDNRRIDIYVTIKNRSDTYCLAIENKPYAGDQERQIADYLEHLKRYGEKFLLIYLPSRSQRPSESSLPESEYKDWNGRFKIMAYCNDPELVEIESESGEIDNSGGQSESEAKNEELANYHIQFSLADWISGCRKNCEVGRLRSFLKDIEKFCHQRFGDHFMINDSERQAIEKFVFENPEKNIRTAENISEYWPHIRDSVCHNFFKLICSQIDASISTLGPAIRLQNRDKKRGNPTQAFIYSEEWDVEDFREGITIGLESDSPAYNDWFIGIQIRNFLKSGANLEERYIGLINEIEKAVGEEDLLARFTWEKSVQNDWWQLSCYLDESMKDWHSLLPQLRKEAKNRGGEVADYYVSSLVGLAKVATPIINDFKNAEQT